ncbi:Uncharacterised protein [Mycobacteroides abscessus subsp. abscessus]|nr:Uncharacterised protein [Mycobacteroides abscessus subsp. abscessus]
MCSGMSRRTWYPAARKAGTISAGPGVCLSSSDGEGPRTSTNATRVVPTRSPTSSAMRAMVATPATERVP